MKEDKILIERLKLNNSSLRKFFYIIRTDKERRRILDETIFYKTIYNAVEVNKILEAVINKYIKIKIHKCLFLEPYKNDIEEFKRNRNDYIL